MGKKNKQALGKSIIKHRTRSVGNTNSWLHCSELVDDVAPNLQSITEQSTLDDFLATAELAGTEFAAEKLNVTIVTPRQNEGLLTKEIADAIKQAQRENEHFLRIPRRPDWDKNMTPEELDEKERNAFLQWRRQLAKLQEKEHILLTPFERNLDFWRQLWRVIERSDVVVQIVDARNPLLYRCEDLENYVIEVDPKKSNLLLINKADFLTADQRGMWARYFNSIGLKVAFWSAHLESERLTAECKSSDEGDNPDENQPEEQSEEESDRVLSKFSEMSVEQKGDSEVELECTSVVDESTGVREVGLDQSTFHNSGTENQSVLHPSNKSGTAKECLNQDLPPGKSCKLEIVGLHVTTGFSTRKTALQQQPSPFSNARQIDEPDTNNYSSDLQRTPSDLCCPKTLEESKQFVEISVDLERTCVTEDNLLNTDNKNIDGDFSGKILTKDELLALFKTLHSENGEEDFVKETPKTLTTVGLVGYPNVGKSSTINALLADKKVPVSATPGRTKHFQTLYVSDEILLCDCPGLVFPSFVSTKADMVLNGILPIDQMRDHVPPVSLICQRIPRDVLEIVYGINIPPPQEGEDPDRAPYADEVLSAYGYMRGFMTSHGLPDCARSARYILKDYVKGKLLYCIPPPGEDECDFQQIGHKLQKLIDGEGKAKKIHETSHKQMSDVDQDFFRQEQVRCFSRGFHATGRQLTPGLRTQTTTTGAPMGWEGGEAGVPYKPWKKHYNRNKREKLRRLAKK